MKIVFLGTPQLAVPSLEYLARKFNVLCAITQPDKPQGRGHKVQAPPIKISAQNLQIPVFQTVSIRKDTELIQKLIDMEPDFFITVAFGQILSQEVLDIPKFGTINLHASLLPEYRGANPIQRAIVEGKEKTGITTMLTCLELDAGDILLQEEIKITQNMTTKELSQIIAEKGGNLLEKTILGYSQGKIIPQIQKTEEATFANKYSKEDEILCFDMDAKSFHCKVCGLNRAIVMKNEIPIKITKTLLLDCNATGECGKILKVDKKGIEIQTKRGIILIEKLQPPNKKEMNAFDWANGAQIRSGMHF